MSYELSLNSIYSKQMRGRMRVYFKTLISIIILAVSICNNAALANESIIPPDNHLLFNQMLEEVFDTT
ncbi:MAG: hypothetical protein P0S93_04830, partial [Candidatus Neptunochlamydia sp.]|nr:hypothetical protein [Candidatus Neptunochlamydia sp.]